MGERSGSSGWLTSTAIAHYESGSDAGVSSTSEVSWSASASERHFIGVSTPGFHKLKKSGALLPYTSWYQYEVSRNTSGEYYKGVLNNAPAFHYTTILNREPELHRSLTGAGGILSEFPEASLASGQYHLQSAAARISSRGWDGLTFAGELPQLKRMFKSTAKKMVNLARGHSSKRVLDLWLEGRYGWRTLAYDVRDLDAAINDWDQSRKIYTERAGTSYSERSSKVSTSSNRNATWAYEETFESNHSVRGSVAGRIEPARVIVDPIKTGWELVPYSFVMDWVYGVGVALDAMKFVNMASEYTGAIGTLSKHKYECKLINPSITPATSATHYQTYERTPGLDQVELIVTNRLPSTVSYKPQLTGRLLTSDLGLDLIALSRTRSRF